MKQYFNLSQAVVQQIANTYGTPTLVLSLEQVARNYSFLTEQLPGVKVYYAVKSNPDERIIKTLAGLGSCFDVASDGEMRMLSDLGIEPERIVYANPVKTAGGLEIARQKGIHKFTFDSESEIGKIANAIPGATVLLRIRVDNPKALVDLNKKFGAAPDEALSLLRKAREKGLDVAGLCFHVGSQSTSSTAYLTALQICRELFDEAATDGFQLRLLDIGGGFPIPNGTQKIDVAAMTDEISAMLKTHFSGIEVWAEPGRFICGTAMNLITRVIGTQQRNGQQWYFLDEGLYGTFSGIIFDHWQYDMETFKTGSEILATFAGPSCDSLDVLFRDKLTVPLEMDDLILVRNCGAYSSASATTFNGFAKAQIIVWEKICEELTGYSNLPTAG
ncbi:MAG: ldc [Firmicutes bacterium]|nr:ldc [Bacillota bacterium]